MSFRFEFEWDPAKAESNLVKHGVAFSAAATIFNDPLALTIPDAGHSDLELRWITIGTVHDGTLMVVVHTFSRNCAKAGKNSYHFSTLAYRPGNAGL